MDDTVQRKIHNVLAYEMGQTSVDQLVFALLELPDDRAEHLISQFMNMRLDGWSVLYVSWCCLVLITSQ